MNNPTERYYYVRANGDTHSKLGHPIACVCLFKDDNGTFWRGVSICSEKDQFKKEIARSVAKKNIEFAICINGDIYGASTSTAVRNVVKAIGNKAFTSDNALFHNGNESMYIKASSVDTVPLSEYERHIVQDIL